MSGRAKLRYLLEGEDNEAFLEETVLQQNNAETMGYRESGERENFKEYTERRWRYPLRDENIDFKSYHDLVPIAIEYHFRFLMKEDIVSQEEIERILDLRDIDPSTSIPETVRDMGGNPKNLVDSEKLMENLYIEYDAGKS